METIRLDIVPKGLMPICHASQYDIGRVIRLNLMDGLQGYTLTDETVVLNVRKPDNNIVTAAVEVVSGKSYVDIVTTEQMTACEGDNLCEIVISKGDTRVASLNFRMQVEVDPLKDGIESETEIHNLETQIQAINDAIVPDMVAAEVADQYDSSNVIFDDHPIAGHGTGYVVKSENVPDDLNDLTDVNISSPTSNQALVYDPVTGKWVNGEVSTVGSIDDLNDVDTTGKNEGDNLRYDGNEWVAKPTTVTMTLAEWNDMSASEQTEWLNSHKKTRLIFSDAPNLNETAKQISYDGGTDTVWDEVESRLLPYKAGDSIDLTEVWAYGYQGNSTTRVFFIPLSKPLASGVSVALNSVKVSAYSASGAGETWSNSTLSSLGTITLDKASNGIKVTVALSSSVSTAVYTPIIVRCLSGSIDIS